MIRFVNRTLLVFLVLVPVGAGLGTASALLDLPSGVVTALALAAIMLVALIDREGFYGKPRNPPSR
jgi:hypothetical protein